jgi:hypothetical protein
VLRLGVWPAEHFQQAPWTARRWAFVAQRLAAISTAVVWADGARLQQALQPAARVLTADHPELPASWPAAWRQAAPPLLPEPPRPCGSFSQFWRQATRGIGQLDALPGWPLPRQQPRS